MVCLYIFINLLIPKAQAALWSWKSFSVPIGSMSSNILMCTEMYQLCKNCGFSYMIPKQFDAKWKKQSLMQELWLHDTIKWWKHQMPLFLFFFFFFWVCYCSLWVDSPTTCGPWPPLSESIILITRLPGIPKPPNSYTGPFWCHGRPGFYREVENV